MFTAYLSVLLKIRQAISQGYQISGNTILDALAVIGSINSDRLSRGRHKFILRVPFSIWRDRETSFLSPSLGISASRFWCRTRTGIRDGSKNQLLLPWPNDQQSRPRAGFAVQCVAGVFQHDSTSDSSPLPILIDRKPTDGQGWNAIGMVFSEPCEALV